jgi:hypothetical protein
VVIQSVLEENRRLYQSQYDELVGRLLQIPKGSLRRKARGGAQYVYLRRHVAGRGYEDVYLGPAADKRVAAMVKFVDERSRRITERRAVLEALHALGVRNVELQEKGYHRIFADLMEAFTQAGLWDEGLMLIGSWCFNVYVQVFGVAFYPLRTMDFDLALRIPYRGDKADVDALLRNLGFTARVDAAYGKIDYVLPGVGMVEVFIDREQATREAVAAVREDLSIVPAQVAHLQILLDHPVTAKVHGVHKAVTLPSMPAFFVHRLITARFGEYRDAVLYPEKIRKDLKQAALVAARIESDEDLVAQLKDIANGLPQDLREKMRRSAAEAVTYVQTPDFTIEDAAGIRSMMQMALA